MRHKSLPLGFVLAATILLTAPAALAAGGASGVFSSAPAPVSYSRPAFVQPYLTGGFGYMGGYYSPFVSVPTLPPPYPYMPKYWWTGPYSIDDPRQAGYNPQAGYRWDDVMALILHTSPEKARVSLDGMFVGLGDQLGPIQLPVGEHTLRVDAAGYEPSETVLKVETHAIQQLDVRLNKVEHAPKPAPKL